MENVQILILSATATLVLSVFGWMVTDIIKHW